LKREALGFLACPECGKDLSLDTHDKGEEVESGLLSCGVCHARYPVVGFVPRFVPSDSYVRSFSMEWNIHAQTQLDSHSGTHETEETFGSKTGWLPDEIEGRLCLDVGCGTGRFMEVTLNWGGIVLGMDLSNAVDAAMKNVGFRRNAHVIQADIFRPPLKKNLFDRVYSIGVIHHTPDPGRAFGSIAKLVRPNGLVAVWVYSDEGYQGVISNVYNKALNRTSSAYRLLTTRLPLRALYRVSRGANTLYKVKKYRRIALVLNVIIPTSTHQNAEWRVLDTFDWYSPKYQWRLTRRAVKSWFADAKLENVRFLPGFATSISAVGKKPAGAAN